MTDVAISFRPRADGDPCGDAKMDSRMRGDDGSRRSLPVQSWT